MVADSSRNPVHGLTAADFTIREDGHPETIKSFEEHTADQAATGPQLSTMHVDPGVFTNEFAEPASGALNLILFDQLNSPEAVQKQVLDQVRQYLSNAPRGFRFAILVLNSRQLSLVQGFTSDRDLLIAALSSKITAPSFPTYLDRSDPSLQGTALAQSDPGGGRGGDITARVKRETRIQLTLNSLNQLGRYLSQIPGRKNLLWFSSSFPVSILPNGDEPQDTRPGYVDEFRETVNQFAHNQISLFPIDARGLATVNIREDISPSRMTSGGNSVVPSQHDSFSFSNAAMLSAMRDLADATGGMTFANSNALKQAAARAVEAGSNYYTLAYSPANDKLNDKYRNIHVEVARKGLTLSYRRGYYATDPDHHPQEQKTAVAGTPADAQPAYNAMRTAMTFGGPESTQVLFSVAVRQSSPGDEPSVYANNQPSATAKGPFKRYNVHFKAHLDDIVCDPTPQGQLYCAVEFVTRVFDADGQVINTQVNDIKETVKPDYFASLHRIGQHPELQYNQQISVPAKGDFSLRIGIHDLVSNHVGALEFPVSAVSSLPTTSTPSPPVSK
jgi:VWFA-related protein